MLDLFAGCGGLSQGFEDAGFKVVAANDSWNVALESFKKNHPGVETVLGDITDPEVQKKIVDIVNRDVDVIVGGPPCQAFSLAGTRDPNDPRGGLFEEYVKMVNVIRPKVFVMENVKGILTMRHFKAGMEEGDRRKGGLLLKSIAVLKDFRWAVKNQKVPSRHYPLFEKILAWHPTVRRLDSHAMGQLEAEDLGELSEFRQALKGKVSAKVKAVSNPRTLLNQIERKIKSLDHLLQAYLEPVTEIIKRSFEEIGYSVEFQLLNAVNYGVPQLRERVFFIGTKDNGLDPKKLFSDPTHAEKSQWASIGAALEGLKDPDEDPDDEYYVGGFSSHYMSRNRRKGWNEPSFTIQAGARHAPLHPSSPKMGKLEKDKWEFTSEEGVRRLSVREIARIQTFPDWYEFDDKITNCYALIGNAVPPLLGKAVAEAVLNGLTGKAMAPKAKSQTQKIKA